MQLRQRLAQNDFSLLMEIEPPKGTDVDPALRCARQLRGRLAAFVVSEMRSAVMRMSALGCALLLQRSGLETVVQVCCRDRNRLALQADMLAAAGGGIGNLHVVAGEAAAHGDHPDACCVADLDDTGLIGAARSLCRGTDLAGIDLAGRPDFFIGASLNLNARADDPQGALEEFEVKRAAGAHFFITSAIFDPSPAAVLVERARTLQIPLIATVMLLKSVGMARYIQRNLPHLGITDELVARVQQAPDRVRECCRIAADTIAACRRAGFRGVLIAPLGWETKVPAVLESLAA